MNYELCTTKILLCAAFIWNVDQENAKIRSTNRSSTTNFSPFLSSFYKLLSGSTKLKYAINFEKWWDLPDRRVLWKLKIRIFLWYIGGDPRGMGGTCPPPDFLRKNTNFFNQEKKMAPLKRLKVYSNDHFLSIHCICLKKALHLSYNG